MRPRPISPAVLITEITDRVLAGSGPDVGRVCLGVDGADAAGPDEFADALVDPLRVRGRAVLRVRTGDYLRPAALRFERGRTDPDSLLEDWLDSDALRRDVLDRLREPGDARIRPVRWDATADRASRSGFVAVPAGGVVIVSGPLLLGRGLDFDLTVHLDLSPGALSRRTPPELAWTLPAYRRYAEQVDPLAAADIVVRLDDPGHPAVAP